MAAGLHISPFRWVSFALLGVGLAAAGYLYSSHKEEKTAAEPVERVGGVYKADIPLEDVPHPLLESLIPLSAEELASVPEIDGFQWPCGATNGALTYDAQPFGSDNELRGGKHVGMDLNGIGGENTDEGMPVRAAARGLVVYSGLPADAWGNVVVVAHRLPGTQRIIQTIYAHLGERKVRPGQMVGRGQDIGTIGTAGGRYLGHLHFEAVESRCIEAGAPGYHANGTMNRLNPEQLIADHPAPAMADPYESVRRLRIRENYLQQNNAQEGNTSLPSAPIPETPATPTKP